MAEIGEYDEGLAPDMAVETLISLKLSFIVVAASTPPPPPPPALVAATYSSFLMMSSRRAAYSASVCVVDVVLDGDGRGA